MKLTNEERNILAHVKFSNRDKPYGEQVADAMRSLWELYTGARTANPMAFFQGSYWHKLLANARTRWTAPLDGDWKITTVYDPAIRKFRAEGQCLKAKGGVCENPCPNPTMQICEPAKEFDIKCVEEK